LSILIVSLCTSHTLSTVPRGSMFVQQATTNGSFSYGVS
jgi:hypothetical protein